MAENDMENIKGLVKHLGGEFVGETDGNQIFWLPTTEATNWVVEQINTGDRQIPTYAVWATLQKDPREFMVEVLPRWDRASR